MAKKLFTTAIALLLCMGAFAQGINFREISFAEALEQSAAEKKPVFLDCYTTWCGPCKHMADQVFTLKEAGDYFNKHYVNIKIDMEKGEGVELAKKYSIRAYPTFLILDSEGTEIHRVVGGGTLNDFIARIEAGTNSKKSLATLESEYESGKISKKDLTTYWLLVRGGGSAAREKTEEVSAKLFDMLSKGDKLKEIYWPLVRSKATPPDGEGMNFILSNRKALEKKIGADQVDNVISASFSQAITQMIANPIKPEQAGKLPAIVAKMKTTDIGNKDELLLLAEMAQAKADNDADRYIDLLEEHAGELSGMALFNAFTGANALATGENAKKYYARLAELATELGSNPEAGNLGQYLEVMAAGYKRKSNTGVYWEEFASLEDALAQAKKEQRRVFLDCYTTWCGPCRHMTENVFTQEEVGDFFNERFINIKIDMEKGEGPEVAERFGVRAYPTFVIINPDGSMRHVIVGGGDGPGFIERVKAAFDDKTALGVTAAKFEAGERDREFLLDYMKALKRNYSPEAANVAQALFETLDDAERLSPDNWVLFEDADFSPAGSETEKYLIANLDAFRNAQGREKVDEKLGGSYQRTLGMIILGRDEKTTTEEIDAMVKEIKSYGLAQAPALIAYADMAKLVKKGDKSARNYKRAAKNLKAEESQFLGLYSRYKDDLTPAQLREWQNWGKELAAAATNQQFKEYLEKFLTQK